MSYPKDLDGYTTDELVSEINQRCVRVARDRCPYCNYELAKCTCKLSRSNEERQNYHNPFAVQQLKGD